MKYNLQIPLNFSQLLDLVLQLPKTAQTRLVVAIENQEKTLPKIKMKTIVQIKDKNYQYPNKEPQKMVGLWEDDGVIEFFLKKNNLNL
jgi:hypothetical protein